MVKASIEVVKNVDGRVESGVVIVQGRKLRFNNVWDDDGFLRTINFDGRIVPSMAELYWFMNEKFIERIRRINFIDLISEITLIKTIDTINEINTINDVTLISQAKTDHRWIKGVELQNPTFPACIPTSVENDAIAYDAVNDRFNVNVSAALPAGTNNIGDVDVLSLPTIPQSTKHDSKTYIYAFGDIAATGLLGLAKAATKVIKIHHYSLQSTVDGVTAYFYEETSTTQLSKKWVLNAREGQESPFVPAPANLPKCATQNKDMGINISGGASPHIYWEIIYSVDDAS